MPSIFAASPSCDRIFLRLSKGQIVVLVKTSILFLVERQSSIASYVEQEALPFWMAMHVCQWFAGHENEWAHSGAFYAIKHHDKLPVYRMNRNKKLRWQRTKRCAALNKKNWTFATLSADHGVQTVCKIKLNWPWVRALKRVHQITHSHMQDSSDADPVVLINTASTSGTSLSHRSTSLTFQKLIFRTMK